jgi:hypothetical protein
MQGRVSIKKNRTVKILTIFVILILIIAFFVVISKITVKIQTARCLENEKIYSEKMPYIKNKDIFSMYYKTVSRTPCDEPEKYTQKMLSRLERFDLYSHLAVFAWQSNRVQDLEIFRLASKKITNKMTNKEKNSPGYKMFQSRLEFIKQAEAEA